MYFRVNFFIYINLSMLKMYATTTIAVWIVFYLAKNERKKGKIFSVRIPKRKIEKKCRVMIKHEQ